MHTKSFFLSIASAVMLISGIMSLNPMAFAQTPLGGDSTLPVATSALPASTLAASAAADLIVYQEGLQSPWQDNSWSAAVTYASTERPYAGINSIKVVQNAWGGLSAHIGTWGAAVNVDPTAYARLEFAIYGGTAGLTLAVQLENDAAAAFPRIAYGTIPANQWVVVTLPMSQIDPANQPIDRLNILEMSGVVKTYFVDAVRFAATAQVTVPAAPALASPANGAGGVALAPSLAWTASSGATSYRVQLSTNAGFTSTIADQAGLTGLSWTAAGLSNSTLYYWRVNASNASGAGAWSAAASFTTLALPAFPPAPALSAPANLAAGVGTAPSLAWGGATGALAYRLQVSTTAAFASNVVDQIGLTALSYGASGLAYGTTYFWRVNASNASGAGSWSTIWSFSTGAQPVAAVELPVYQDAIAAPWQDNSWSAAVTYASTEKAYAGLTSVKVVQNPWGGLSLHDGIWGAAANVAAGLYSTFEFAAYGGATGISLAVRMENDLAAAFSQIVYGPVPANQWAIISIPMSQLNPGGQPIDRVNIMEMSGQVKTFFIDAIRFVGASQASAPGAPVLASPLNGATGVALPVLLGWIASVGATSYRVQTSTSAAFTTTSSDQSGVTALGATPGGLLTSATYYWRVNASNGVGTSPWSGVSSFATAATVSVPAAPALASPADGATNQSVTPSLAWSASAGAATYRMQLATNSAFAPTLLDQSGISALSYVPAGLSPGATYYWRVSATNQAGSSAFSASRSFATAAAAPPPPAGSMFVTAYFPDWSIWTMKPWQVDFTAMTHVIHFSADPDPATAPYFSPVTIAADSIKLQYGSGSTDRSINFQDSLIVYAHRSGVKALICIGGIYGTSDGKMDQVCSDITKIRAFVSAISRYCRRKGYDGVDIDWEFPNNQTDYANLLTVMRDTLDRWPTKGVITVAVNMSPSNPYMGANVALMNAKVDQINLMNYDMGVSTYAGFNSPLKPGECKTAGGTWTAWTLADHSLDLWIAAGFAKAKLALGMPFYAWEFTGVDGPCQLRTGGASYRSYNDALNYRAQYPNSYRWDDSSKVPYLSFTDASGMKHMVSYDDSLSLAYKVAWAKKKGVGGLMLYELMSGWVQSLPAGKRDPLLQAVKRAVAGQMALPAEAAAGEVAADPAAANAPTGVPATFALDQNYPNPFNPTTTIRFQLPVSSTVTIKIYDTIGREVAALAEGSMEAGVHSIQWDSRNVGSPGTELEFAL